MKLYVNMVDRFMSGWGKCSGGGVSRYSIECETREQADAIEKAAHDRGEMKYVSICLNPPKKRSAADHVKIVPFADVGGPWLTYYSEGA